MSWSFHAARLYLNNCHNPNYNVNSTQFILYHTCRKKQLRAEILEKVKFANTIIGAVNGHGRGEVTALEVGNEAILKGNKLKFRGWEDIYFRVSCIFWILFEIWNLKSENSIFNPPITKNTKRQNAKRKKCKKKNIICKKNMF